MWYADVIVDISLEKLDRTFQYILPAELIGVAEVGSMVNVPFGNRKITGYVVGITDEPAIDAARLKPIESVVENGVPIEGRLIRIAYWMKHNYGSTINQALKTVLPVKEVIKDKQIRYIKLASDYIDDTAPKGTSEEITVRVNTECSIGSAGECRQTGLDKLIAECARKHYAAKVRLLEALRDEYELPENMVTTKLNIASSTIKSLEKQGVIEVVATKEYRNPIKKDFEASKKMQLNSEQQFVVNSIIEDYDNGVRDTYLIKGVTGSGKTEVYMEIIEHVLSEGRQVIMLIPEIALTFQTVMRFYKRFGNIVSILNSRMSKGERYDQYLRVKNGDIKIIIGPRSALFAPFENLGLIVIDEEHESAYKSEGVPKYHARETAVEIARMTGAAVILGSATPSVDAYYKARSGEYKLFVLNNRATKNTLPEVEVVDLREELKSGNRSMFSGRLQTLIEDRLKKKEQIMLFLNRRGYVGFINCRNCGYVVKCPHCDVSLTAHRNGMLVCHYCGYTEKDKKVCPSCGSKYIGGFKAGTEKVEQSVKELFPDARVLRMDLDTTKGKDGHEKILEQFASGEADILVGTQMIVKGHDFSKVTLVGILLADLSLYASSYRAQERTFDLLTQAAGRAGRGEIPGNVVIQTYDPEHYSIQMAKNQDYDGFYDSEIMYRDLMDYPPVSNLMVVKGFSKDEDTALNTLEILKKECTGDNEELNVIGPSKANIYKINDIFYYLLYLKHKEYTVLTYIKDKMEKYIEDNPDAFKNSSVQFDFNP